MFSNDIVGSDAFLEMPTTSQALYFHLGMRCDDDGFVNPNVTMRMTGANKNDLDVLVSKRFLLLFKNGVVVIKHHRINNNWDSRDSRRTLYTEELKLLFIKDNKGYTLDKSQGESVLKIYPKEIKLLPDGNPTETRRQKRIEEKRINTSNFSKEKYTPLKTNNKKTMRKNRIGSYNENNNSDNYEDSIDIDTGEFSKPKEPKRQKAINYIKEYFVSKCEKEIKISPILTVKHNIIIANLFNKNKMKPSDITDVIDWWFETEQDKTKLIQISNCLSAWNINKFKVAKEL